MPNPPALPLPLPRTAAADGRAPETWAEVRAHDHVMRYRRSGAGRVVLVLHADGDDGAADSLWPELAAALAERFRLIVPEAPADGADVADVSAWLGDFLEGLGAAGVALVAADRLCIPALELALLDADQIARVVLVPGGPATESGLDGALATTARRTSIPLLVVRRGTPAAEAVPLVMGFLG